MSAIINGINKPENSHRIEFVKIITSSGKEYDITPIMVFCNIFEDIRDDSIDGTLAISDVNNILSNYPIIGRETLKMKFASRANDGTWLPFYEKEFDILNANNQTREKTNSNDVVKINFTSKPYFKNCQTRVSKSYNQKTNHFVVNELMEGLGVPIDCEPTLYPRNQVIPNVTPFEWIKTLCKESTSKKNLSSDYVFFENADGYHFKSAYSLMQQEPKLDLTYYIETSQNAYDRLNVQQYVNNTPFDILEQLDGGLGSTSFTLDINNKDYTINTTDYYKHIQSFPTMNGGSLYVDNTQEQFPLSKYVYGVADGFYSSDNLDNTNKELKRLANITLLESSPITIELPGSTDIKTGHTINFTIKAQDEVDTFRSGKFLITRIKHSITASTYSMTLELLKDSNIISRKKL